MRRSASFCGSGRKTKSRAFGSLVGGTLWYQLSLASAAAKLRGYSEEHPNGLGRKPGPASAVAPCVASHLRFQRRTVPCVRAVLHSGSPRRAQDWPGSKSSAVNGDSCTKSQLPDENGASN